MTNEYVVVYCIYLPPDSSKYGQNNENVLNLLTIEMYKHANTKNILICGDFNARAGTRNECDDKDGISNHKNPDTIVNAQGLKLLNFISDIRGCIINGRVNCEQNDFISVAAHKGLAVVDYHITRKDDINAILEMSVISCIELAARLQVERLISNNSRLPDHNMSCMTMETLVPVLELSQDRNLGAKNVQCQKVYRKVGHEYMKSETAIRMLHTLIENFESVDGQQQEINVCYNECTHFILTEAELSLKNNRKKRKNTKFKPYWDSELSKKWKIMHEAERAFRRARKHKAHNMTFMQNCFRRKQNAFDKLLCKKKRAYHKGLMLEIERCNNKDPNAFWNFIKKLGPQKNNEIPWKVCMNNKIVTDREGVLNKWKEDYEKLYNVNNVTFDDAFKEQIENEYKEKQIRNRKKLKSIV